MDADESPVDIPPVRALSTGPIPTALPAKTRKEVDPGFAVATAALVGAGVLITLFCILYAAHGTA